jgi:Beta-galactosidase/beta-glucuronidase
MMKTRWSDDALNGFFADEYPRPQLQRENWSSLNGLWQYAITDADAPCPKAMDGDIRVPFSPESLLSGVKRSLQFGQALWYKRSFSSPVCNKKERVLLHFGAVDQTCMVYLNGVEIGSHAGGYWPFHFDISAHMKAAENTLTVRVLDTSDMGDEAYGKQKTKRGGIWYTPQSGIWQTVWLECVPENHVASLLITPDYDGAAVDISVQMAMPEATVEITAQIFDAGQIVSEAILTDGHVCIPLENFKSWSPDDPFLYDIVITAGEDSVKSYFGMRKFSTVVDKGGHPRLALNNRPIFHNGLLDQGYWSDGLYTSPCDAAMAWEISELKRLGFNMLRKHIKIEPLRWYYHCDRIGMLVWQDFVSGGGPYSPLVIQALPFAGFRLKDSHYGLFGRKSEKGRAVFQRDMRRTIGLLQNTVSLCTWVPFNEGWGQFDAARIAKEVKALDSTRHIDHASGWHDQRAGDFHSPHVYFVPFKLKRDRFRRVDILSEFGGYSCPTEGHMFSAKLFGYKMCKSEAELAAAYKKLYEKEILPAVAQGLSASVYTQVSDVEEEINGLFTYDREKLKLPEELLIDVNKQLTLSIED